MENILALPIGTEINHYVIESVLGQGGFGVVYKAHHAHLDEEVVIKEFLPVELASRQGETVTPHGTSKQDVYGDCLRRFMEEGRTLVKLRHPNVVRCRDLFTTNGTAYLVMDFEDGLALDELITSLESQGQHYSQEQLMHFLLPLADGLSYIHSQGVLHRDIKPANIFIRRSDGSPVLIDFGAAKQNFALASQSQAPYTEFYAPMEQIEGGGEAKPTIDIHAFGALIYRIVTGTKGTKAESRTLAFAMGKPDPLTSASELKKGDYSMSLMSLVDDCLQFKASDRPQTMEQVKERLLSIESKDQIDGPDASTLLAKLDDLISLAGSDGEISEAEMKLILDKAVMLTIDPASAQQYVVAKATKNGWKIESKSTQKQPTTPSSTPPPSSPPPPPFPKDDKDSAEKPKPAGQPVWPTEEKTGSSGGMKWVLLSFVFIAIAVGGFYGYTAYEEKQLELAKHKRYLAQKQRELDKQKREQAEQLAREQAERDKRNADDQAWNAAAKINSRSSYQNYLDLQPEGRYRTSAQNRIDEFDRIAQQRKFDDRDKKAWEKAKSANTAMDYDGYLDAYPAGDYRANAEAALRQLSKEGLNPSDAVEQFRLGNDYRNGKDVEKSYPQAIYWYTRSSAQGHGGSSNNLGFMHEYGYGLKKSSKEAAKWYMKGAEQGDDYAQNNIGILYRDGDGVTQSHSEAVKWFRKSVEQDNADALVNLGLQYSRGDGVPQNKAEAARLYLAAAEKGDEWGQNNLGALYRNGEGVQQSHTEAIKWFRKSADQGHASAQVNLGLQYERGHGVTQSNTEAVKWYRKAAEQGNVWGQYDLGLCYEYGRGVNKSLSTAIEWYKKAARGGHKSSQERLTEKGYTW